MNRIVAALGLLMLVSSCREDRGPVVPELQPISAPRTPYKVDATSDERFLPHADRSKRFRYFPGSSWAELRSTQFRTLNFAFGPDGVGECYLSEIVGFVDGGLDNVNRWRVQQMGLAPMVSGDLKQLPRKPFAGGEGVFVKLDGSFKGMGEQGGREGYRMLGMLFTRGCEAYSVKMTGPRALLEREESEFLAFCETLTIVPDMNRDPYMQLKVGPFEFLRPCDWDYFVPDHDAVVRRPLGFTIGENKEATADMGIILDPAQGSLAKVLNGWLEKHGREPLADEAAIASLPDQALLGAMGKWLEIEEGGKTFVGIVSQLNSEGHEPMTIVATLRGPSDLVAGEKIMLRTFAESLRLGPVGGAGAASPH